MSDQKPGQGNSDHLVVRLSLLSPRPITIIGRRRRLIGEGRKEQGGKGIISLSSLPSFPRPPKVARKRGKRETDPILFPVQRKSEAREGRAEYVSTKGFLCVCDAINMHVSQSALQSIQLPYWEQLFWESWDGSRATAEVPRKRRFGRR